VQSGPPSVARSERNGCEHTNANRPKQLTVPKQKTKQNKNNKTKKDVEAAKWRAVRQGADYATFRAMVSAAHLRASPRG